MQHTCQVDDYHISSIEREDVEKNGYFKRQPGEIVAWEFPIGAWNRFSILFVNTYKVVVFPLSLLAWHLARQRAPHRRFFDEPYANFERLFLTNFRVMTVCLDRRGSFTIQCLPVRQVRSISQDRNSFMFETSEKDRSLSFTMYGETYTAEDVIAALKKHFPKIPILEQR